MPKQPIDYSKSIIYKIYCNNPDVKEIYVGSTTDFKSRKSRHKCRCSTEYNKYSNIKLYKIINNNGGWDNFSMIPIIEYPCENNIQLLIKEEEYRKELNAELNMVKCYTGLTKQEYMKEYMKENIEKKKEYNKEYGKLYRENNKEYIEKRRGETIICSCGKNIRKDSILRHEKSKFHKDFIQNNISFNNING